MTSAAPISLSPPPTRPGSAPDRLSGAPSGNTSGLLESESFTSGRFDIEEQPHEKGDAAHPAQVAVPTGEDVTAHRHDPDIEEHEEDKGDGSAPFPDADPAPEVLSGEKQPRADIPADAAGTGTPAPKAPLDDAPDAKETRRDDGRDMPPLATDSRHVRSVLAGAPDSRPEPRPTSFFPMQTDAERRLRLLAADHADGANAETRDMAGKRSMTSPATSAQTATSAMTGLASASAGTWTVRPEASGPAPAFRDDEVDADSALRGPLPTHGPHRGAIVAGAPVFSSTPPANVMPQIVQALLTSTGETTEIALSPRELGHVRITLKGDGDNVTLLLQVERTETMSLLRRHADQLVAELLDAGYTNVDVGFGEWASDAERGQHAEDSDAPPPMTVIGAAGPPATDTARPERHHAGLYLRI